MSILGAGGSGNQLTGPTIFDGIPILLNVNTNDLQVNPDNFTSLDLNASIALNLTGLQGARKNRFLLIVNKGPNTVTLTNADSSSLAGNRFNLGANIALAQNGAVLLLGTTNIGWLLIANSQAGTGAGSGTVTSVSFADTSTTPIFTDAVANPTTTPAITQALKTQAANLVFAGPTTGAAAQPGFRALVAGDLPAGVGTVSSVSSLSPNSTITTSVANPTTTPAISIDITPQAVTDALAAISDKPAVTVVATANLTLSGVQTIDGFAGTAGTTLVLATAQTTASQNGPWLMQSGAWTRPTWYASANALQAFQFITTLIRQGTTYQGSTWRLTTAGAIIIDTTTTTWSVTPIALNANTVASAEFAIPTDVQDFTSSGTWTKPSTVAGQAPKVTHVIAIGAGGGGGSGPSYTVVGVAGSGGAGGGGGLYKEFWFATSGLGATETVAIGAGGTGGASVNPQNPGNPGVAGGNSTFGTWLTAYGGGRGAGGQLAAGVSGGGGSAGVSGAGGNATTVTNGIAGLGGGFIGGGSALLSGGANTGSGGSGNGTTGAANAGVSGNTGGGGSGGGISTTTAQPGATGGAAAQIAGGAGGAATGAVGQPGVNPTDGYLPGSAGGGGGANATGAAGIGGAGGIGSGGGGGGLSATGASGAGGAGGNGRIVVITHY